MSVPSSCGEIEPDCLTIKSMWMACGTILESLGNQQVLDIVFFLDVTRGGIVGGGMGPPTPPGSYGRDRGHICSSYARPYSGENIGEMGQYVYRGGAPLRPKVNYPKMGVLRISDFRETFSVCLALPLPKKWQQTWQ